MKNLLLSLFILATSLLAAQESELQLLDLQLANYEYPYPVSTITVNAQNQALEMAFMDVKPNHYNGKNIMLFHGKNFNGAYWKTTIEALTAEGYRVIVPDQIGFGKSTKPDHFHYTFQQLALSTKTVLDSIGVEKTAVLGHSMGGMLATRFALMFPETTEKLILENPIGLEDWKLKVPYKPVEWWYKNELKKEYASIKKYQLESYYDGNWDPAYDEWVNLLAGWTLNSEYETIAWNAALTYDMIFTQPVVYEFSEIHVPTLLIIGTRDRTALGKPLVSEDVRKTMGLYNELGKATQQKIPNSELVEIPNTGHLPHIERFPKFIAPLKKFLKK
ncbi:alpha/beta fold hydrolase [Leeuwenhoekiella marinoflava]|uniref:Pimeloyl-ACP methyl ester carboxylesterase n=2 Tax=Leeuwenhoekiella marinoflava TaxID=988 RepID=A0A4Q0PL75_9FLAO|nr:alpha/beta hydrolase [Leeuwenhoekiella marinoflava]RXG29076.1 pimeloyl-ACP methyl ester carboxylesterase [Leeuwenhoekiella marinoflava]SHF47234.1 Pimeloyl-ACP methyl ester carboxylesterase [Leeuwenhoekiella marinoflava DSM 3653]